MDELTKITIRLPERLVKAAKIRAVQIDQDLQDVVRLALEDYLGKRRGGR
jgi:predicted DNA binding CopG/RHH family protein